MIYEDLKKRIKNEEYKYQEKIPSETNLILEYNCSRNTLRRAIKKLGADGYVQSIRGKGVIVLYNANLENNLIKKGSHSFSQMADRNKIKFRTSVLLFDEIEINKKMALESTFPVGTPVYYIKRLRSIGDDNYIIEENYFMRKVVKDLTIGIAQDSIYKYLNDVLNEPIATTKRILTFGIATDQDKKYLNLNLNGYNAVPIVTNYSFTNDGTMFEYTVSHHRPDKFIFYDQNQTNPVSFMLNK
ncbi:GntR family transcriptional regulator [Companilactobacillus paralimentarius]|uniref:GntR family transcriptional regulator n=1 Tax=Companilactobacillus paralimentarius TaxID=83526 RepID=UPI0037DFD0A4